MKINFHDLQAQYQAYRAEIDAAIQRVCASCQFIMGPEVNTFENALAAYLECSHVISCASGTNALLLALLAIDLKPGDEVITTPFTFMAAAEMICLLGGKPVFVDIDPDTYNIHAALIEAKITQKTRAILPVSLYGQPADMNEINQLARLYSQQLFKKIYVIEDAAQSLGATYHQKKSGTLSDIGCVSFFPTKPLGCFGDGGAVIVNDERLAEKIKSLRVHGQSKRYEHQFIGLNGRLDAIQAAILQVKLKYFDDELKKRQQIARFYQEQLTYSNITLPYIKAHNISTFAQYTIRVKQRAYVVDYLQQQNIPTAVHYPKALHLQPALKTLGGKFGDFPHAESAASEVLSLPMSAFMTCEQQEYIIEALHAALTNERVINL